MTKPFFNRILYIRQKFLFIIPFIFSFVKQNSKSAAAEAAAPFLSLAEGLAVGTLVHGRIGLVGAHQNPVQRAVVLGIAMVCAGLDGTLNALIGVVVHGSLLLFNEFGISMSGVRKTIHTNCSNIDFYGDLWYGDGKSSTQPID